MRLGSADGPGPMGGWTNDLSWKLSSCLVVLRRLCLGLWVRRPGVGALPGLPQKAVTISQLLENALPSSPLGRLCNLLHALVPSREPVGLFASRFLAGSVGVPVFQMNSQALRGK